MGKLFILLLAIFTGYGFGYGQTFTEILGRPTGNSVTMSILFDRAVEVYWEYGTSPGSYSLSTPVFVALKDSALEADLTNLVPDKKYYYRTRYRASGSAAPFLAGTEHTFQTPRPPGSTFTFAVEADPHLDANSIPDAYALTLQNILAANPDFLLDLGDTFFSEKQPDVNQSVITERHLLYRPYFGSVCHSVPLFLALGNHEGESGWRLNGTPNSIPVMASNTRKKYYPNPVPNAFYSGNIKPEEFVGLRENYYAWEWGDALFVVLDPYWHTVNKPDWGWTLGVDQYNWFKNTLTASKAKFKFVFCHNLVGGNSSDARGGTEFAHLFEMGGSNTDGSWGFDANRPGWGKPIHTLMVENHVTIFFHGHDHFYGKQEKDGVIYQEVPQPSCKNISNLSAPAYGYVNGLFLPGRGYVSLTVSSEETKVEYIRTYLPTEENATRMNGEIADSYVVKYSSSAVKEVQEMPPSLKMDQNYPNPFDRETLVNYCIPTAENVQIAVLDIYGREISRLVNEYQQSGNYSVRLNAADLSLAPGLYLIILRTPSQIISRKMILMK
ncbi:MAG: metallophosphoesterase [Bacteroidia bacterium]|nr:metallophosphoesterase [Bacteroidia bacterium]